MANDCFEDKGFIYVLEGERESNIMRTWYRTPKEVYFNEWRKLLKRYKRKNEHIKVIGTKSGEFDFKREDIFTDSLINNNETLTNVVIDNLKNLNLELFPVVNDFELLITKKRVKFYSEFVYFYSRSKNENLTTFECWKNAKTFLKDLKKKDIPTGTIDKPFSDIDQGWQIIILKKMGLFMSYKVVNLTMKIIQFTPGIELLKRHISMRGEICLINLNDNSYKTILVDEELSIRDLLEVVHC